MHKDQLLKQLLSGLPRVSGVPLRLALWNGAQHDLGPRPTVTVRLHGPGALRCFLPPSIDSLAEGYIHGLFDVQGRVQDVVEAATRLAHASLPIAGRFGRLVRPARHTRELDAAGISHHYDVSNDFYRLWLDPQLVYSCGYFADPAMSLEQAQTAKIDHILNKVMLAPGQRLLDVGCGWGALAIRAAQTRGARVVGITLSRKQFELARERVAQAGLQAQVDIRLQDYRDIDEPFDRITSVGMFEHVGLNHLQAYFGKLRSVLRDGGLVLNHGITTTDPESGGAPLGAGNFIGKYVFPNGELPHLSLAVRHMQAAGLEVLDVENLRRHYTRTLAAWSDNYEKNSDAIQAIVDPSTYRVWRIYLAGCAHAFAQDWVSLYQVLACKAGNDPALNPTPWSRAWMYP